MSFRCRLTQVVLPTDISLGNLVSEISLMNFSIPSALGDMSGSHLPAMIFYRMDNGAGMVRGGRGRDRNSCQ